MTVKKADYEFGYDHEYMKDSMNWRNGEGITILMRRAAGDPKAFRERLDDKIDQVIKRRMEKCSE